MRIPKLVIHLGLYSAVGLLAACGGGEGEQSEPAVQETAPATTEPAPTGQQQSQQTQQTGQTAGNLPAGVTPEMVQQGQQLFAGQANCFTCHGQNAQGSALAPNLADNEWLWVEQGSDMHTQIATVIKTGVTKPKEYPAPMPPMGGAQLDDEQIDALAAYILSLSQGQG